MGGHSTESHPCDLDGHNNESDDFNMYKMLAIGYGIIALIALVQIIRIQIRVPEFGWTTQKVFHLLNFFCASARCAIFAIRNPCEDFFHSELWQSVLLDLPGLVFFSTYTLLVLFWAEIYHQARSFKTDKLRPTFIIVNTIVYIIQAGVWTAEGIEGTKDTNSTTHIIRSVSALFLAFVYVLAAVGFTLYGGRLFVMLRRFPVQSPGRRKKLKEVFCVTTVCTTCFLARAVIVTYGAFDPSKGDLDMVKDNSYKLLNLLYYLAVEIVPSALVLFILRKLPPKRISKDGYQAI